MKSSYQIAARKRAFQMELLQLIPKGRRFGMLTVIRLIKQDGLPRYQCRCDCGQTTIEERNLLAFRAHRSCGCLRNGQKHCRWKTFKNSSRAAAKRGHPWKLTFNQFVELADAPCSYCGKIESATHTHPTNPGKSWRHNSIDRVDNTKGYTSRNCVTACMTCNWMKKDMTHKAFIEHIQQVLKHLQIAPPF